MSWMSPLTVPIDDLADRLGAGLGEQRAQDRHAGLHRVGGQQHLGHEQDPVAEVDADDAHALDEGVVEDLVGAPATVEQDRRALDDLVGQPVVEIVVHLLDELVVGQRGEVEIVLSSSLTAPPTRSCCSTIRNTSASWNTTRRLWSDTKTEVTRFRVRTFQIRRSDRPHCRRPRSSPQADRLSMETALTMKMMTQPRAHALCLAALLTLTAACGNDQSAEPPATSAPVLNTPPATVLPPITGPATTAPATQPPTTTPAPSSTPAVDETKQAVIDAAEHAWHTFNEAKLDPTNPAKVEAAARAHTGERADRVEDYLGEYVTSNRKSVTSDVSCHGDVHEEIRRGRRDCRNCDGRSSVSSAPTRWLSRAAMPTAQIVCSTTRVTAYLERNTFELVNG